MPSCERKYLITPSFQNPILLNNNRCSESTIESTTVDSSWTLVFHSNLCVNAFKNEMYTFLKTVKTVSW